MKKALLTALIFITANSFAQTWVQVPDPNFQAFLTSHYPAGAFMTSGSDFFVDADYADIQNCTELNISNLAIADLTGILAFQNLQVLDCSSNDLSDLTVLPGSLSMLKCQNNQLTSLPELNFINWVDCSNNQLTQLPILSSSPIFSLFCSGNLLSELPELPGLISTLNCSNNQLTALPTMVSTNLIILEAAYNQLTVVPDLPVTLQRLNVSGNQLTTLPDLPSNLELLQCMNNQLTTLPVLPDGLEDLWVSENLFTSLPDLPDSLQSLMCINNQLTTLPALPGTLLSLFCNDNQLTTLPALPGTLLSLLCINNQLVSLPVLPNGIIDILCDSNQLTTLPDLPNSLLTFSCRHNELTSLPLLPDQLTSLGCDFNHLSALPSLSQTLVYLSCGNNDLVDLPNLPQSLRWLQCEENNITTLSVLPDSLEGLNAELNQISCFDEFPSTITFILIGGNPCTCLPNYIPAMDPGILILPLCDENDPVNNPNGCQSAMGVQGLVFNDVNNDCVPSGPVLTYVPMSVHDSGNNLIVQSTSLVNGNYYFAAEPGDYSLSVETANLNPSLGVTCPVGNSSSATVTTSNPVVSAGDFGLKCTGFDLGVQSVVHVDLPFPGETHTLEIVAGDLTAQYNAYCAAGIPGTVTIAVSGPGIVTFGGSPTSTSGNSATYSIADFGIVGANLFTASVLTNTNATANDQFCVSVSVSTATSGDLNPSNNTYNYCYHIVNSHDPNIKETYPEQVSSGYNDEFTYTIHFQNTGNAPAMNIRLADMLDQNLDLSTLKIVNASADYTYSLNMETRLLSIRFPNIMLADSASDPQGSIGFVQYRIKPLENLVLGTVIDNTCNIYFDYNAPITTNTSHNLYSELGFDEVDLNQLKLYPNPAKNQVTLESEELIEEMELYSLNGTKVMTVKTNSKKAQVDVSSLQNGVYLVKVQTQLGIVNKRLVIGQ